MIKKNTFLALILLFQAGVFALTGNSISIKEEAGLTTVNYPVQVGRPFVKGDIANYPQAMVNGIPVHTQADVKARHDDGSVKHAILAFLIPTLNANATVIIDFLNQASGNNTSFLDTAQMLSAAYNFDAVMQLSNGVVKSVSARTMMVNNDLTYWMKGDVTTSVILSDHSTARKYDIGFDSYKPFRPIFHATFWPIINKVHVRYIGECSNSEELEDVPFDLDLKLQNINQQSVYTQAGITHTPGSRWTKDFWIGGAPSTISIDHNFAYLKRSYAIANYDSSITIPETTIAYNYNSWQVAAKTLYEQGSFWYRGMGTGGEHPDIGLLPNWTVRYLYTGDHRAAEEMYGNAELAAAWTCHFRECDSTKKIVRTDSVTSGLGHTICSTGRPTTCLECGYNYNYTDPEDKLTIVGSVSTFGWVPDDQHQPDLYSVPYLLSGDFFYLEQMYMWAGWTSCFYNGAAMGSNYGRGPTGKEGALPGGTRSQAWIFRNRALISYYAPDGSIEKEYFTQMCDDAIAAWEGRRNIIGTSYENTTQWQWSNQFSFLHPPLHQWEKGIPQAAQPEYGVDTSVTLEAMSNFEQHYLMCSLGRGKELGFKVDSLVSYLAKCFVGRLTNPNEFNRYLIGNGRLPTNKKNGQYFQTWAELNTSYNTTWQNKKVFNKAYEYDYEFLAMAATSYTYCEQGGTTAWAFMDTAARGAAILINNPKWAIVPRTCPVPLSLNNLEDQQPVVEVYPNPSSSQQLFVKGIIQAAEVTVLDVNGRNVFAQQVSSEYSGLGVRLNIKVPAGIYFISVKQGNDIQYNKLILIE